MIETLGIERMTVAERLQAMELLWRSFSAAPDELASPAWHKTVLAKTPPQNRIRQGRISHDSPAQETPCDTPRVTRRTISNLKFQI